MREVLLGLAALISAFGLWGHITRGRRLIVQPMLDSDLHMVPKQTLKFGWDWGAVTMSVMVLSFLLPIWRPDLMALSMMATLYAYALGALAFVAMRRGGFSVTQMPQWIVFWAITACGVLAWGVF